MSSQLIYQFYTELYDYEPKVWRHFQVPKNITVARLGYIIMTMFEMQASHLFSIEIINKDNFKRRMGKPCTAKEIEKYLLMEGLEKTQCYEVQNEMTVEFQNDNAQNATDIKVSQVVFQSGEEMKMSYDYGDGWEIKIILDQIIEDKDLPGKELPRVLEGEGYGIIEDCGGTLGLEELAKAFKKKKGVQYEEYCEWLGIDNLDLRAFDVDDMNFRLKKVPRIYKDSYEKGLEPTKQSLNLLMRKYKKR